MRSGWCATAHRVVSLRMPITNMPTKSVMKAVWPSNSSPDSGPLGGAGGAGGVDGVTIGGEVGKVGDGPWPCPGGT